MAIPDAPPGWTRFVVKSKFGAGRDFQVLDPHTQAQVFFIDGKMGAKPKAEVRDAADQVVYRVEGKLLGIPKQMKIKDASGIDVAELKAKAFSLIKSQMNLVTASGEEWILTGSLIEKDYSVSSAAGPIIQITQKWVAVRDSYTLDVASGIDPGLALALLWAVDRWVERD